MQKTIILAFVLLILSGIAMGQVPQLINYQGILIDPATGQPVLDGTYSITFFVYNVPSGGSAIWSETQSVQTRNGLYSVLLGSTTTLTSTILSGPEKYLGIKVGSDPEMTPRKRIVSVAYAILSEDANKLDGKEATEFADATHTHDDRYYTETELNTSDGDPPNQGSNRMSWNNFTDVPEGFADGVDNVSGGGGNTLDQAYDQGGPGAGRAITADAGAFEVGGTDGALFSGTFGSGVIPAQGAGTRMMWYPGKSALRVGTLTTDGSTFWDEDSIGDYSVAMGWDARAIGSYSTVIGRGARATGTVATAMGGSTTASGHYSTAMGRATTASGDYSTASGFYTSAGGSFSTALGTCTNAETYATVAIGRYNVAGGNPTAWVANDPIFEIGIGTGIYDRANAMTVLKSGNVGIGTTSPYHLLDLHENSSSYSYMSFTNETTGGGDGNGVVVGIDPLEDFRVHSWEENNIKLYINNSEKLRINSSGNVGIGDASPTNKLDVAGKIGINDTQLMYLPDQTDFSGTLYLGDGGANLSHLQPNNGRYNTAIGIGALYSNTTGCYNTACGRGALYNNTTGYGNAACGDQALSANTTGYGNAACGRVALANNTTGYGNTAIGFGADVTSDDLHNATAIGYYAKVITSSKVVIGNTNVTVIGGYANWSNLSDGRFKHSVQEDIKGLDFITRLRPVSYKMDLAALNAHLGVESKGDHKYVSNSNKGDIVYSGFIGQEVEAAAREVGYDFSGVVPPQNDKDHYSLRYAEFVVPLVKGMQEQQKMIEDMRNEIAALKKRLGE